MVENQSRKFFFQRDIIFALSENSRAGNQCSIIERKGKVDAKLEKTKQNCKPIEFTKVLHSINSEFFSLLL